jgi:hypothetical protein
MISQKLVIYVFDQIINQNFYIYINVHTHTQHRLLVNTSSFQEINLPCNA